MHACIIKLWLVVSKLHVHIVDKQCSYHGTQRTRVTAWSQMIRNVCGNLAARVAQHVHSS
jgi:hypothetical protein